MKKELILLLILFSFIKANALEVSDLIEPKPFLGRMANTDKVETLIEKDNKIAEQKAQLSPILEQEENDIQEQKHETRSNYADLSLKRLAQEVSYELDLDSAKTSSDLNILWASSLFSGSCKLIFSMNDAKQ